MLERRHEGVVKEACGGQTPVAARRSRGAPALPPHAGEEDSRCSFASKNEDQVVSGGQQ